MFPNYSPALPDWVRDYHVQTRIQTTRMRRMAPRPQAQPRPQVQVPAPVTPPARRGREPYSFDARPDFFLAGGCARVCACACVRMCVRASACVRIGPCRTKNPIYDSPPPLTPDKTWRRIATQSPSPAGYDECSPTIPVSWTSFADACGILRVRMGKGSSA